MISCYLISIVQVASDPLAGNGASASGVEDVVWLSVPRTRKNDTEREGETGAEVSPSIPLPEGAQLVSLACE
jgi:hypothetical protein